MTDPGTTEGEEALAGGSWFCVQTHPKHEHIAAQCLTKLGGFDVFNPRLRVRRPTQRGPVWFVESVFPGYIFVRFELHLHLQTVSSTAGVTQVVHFNTLYPGLTDGQMEELRAIFGATEMVDLTGGVAVGDTVRIQGGAFHDLVAVVQRVWPAKQRVQALLEFLGHVTVIELKLDRIAVDLRATNGQL